MKTFLTMFRTPTFIVLQILKCQNLLYRMYLQTVHNKRYKKNRRCAVNDTRSINIPLINILIILEARKRLDAYTIRGVATP